MVPPEAYAGPERVHIEKLPVGLRFSCRRSLRAIYLNPDTGRFNRLDPWAGSTSDPQSLHKYAYAHCDPVNGLDPNGHFTIIEALKVTFVIAVLVLIGFAIYHSKRRDYGSEVGPEIAPWLFRYMKAEAKRGYDGGTPWMDQNGGGWRTDRGTHTDRLATVPLSDPEDVQTVQIFGQTVPSDVGGNIMFGFVGRFALPSWGLGQLLTISDQGDRRQKWWRGDDPEDRAAITFGWLLADEIYSDRGAFDQPFTYGLFQERFLASPELETMTERVQNLPQVRNYILTEPAGARRVQQP